MLDQLRIGFCLLFVCCPFVLCVSARAQTGAQPVTITIYELSSNDVKRPISVDVLKQYGFSNTTQDPAAVTELLRLVEQGSRKEIARVPKLNAHLRFERSDTGDAYDVSPDGIVRSGTHCYQLSKQDRALLLDAIRNDVFTPDFWEKHTQAPVPVEPWKDLTLGLIDTVGPRQIQSSTVQIAYTVDQDGRPQNLTVIVPSGASVIDYAALDAVKQARYVPGTQDGKPKWFAFVHSFNLPQLSQ